MWVLDLAKGRVAVFDRESRFLFDAIADGNRYRDYDLQLQGERAIVARSTSGVYFIEKRKPSQVQKIYVDGKVYWNYDYLYVTGPDAVRVPPTAPHPGRQGGIFTYLFESEDSGECCFGPAELYVADRGDKAYASEAHGDAPFLDGWLSVRLRKDGQAIYVKADSLTARWERQVDLRFLQQRNGEKRAVSGSLSFEFVVDPRGRIHFLLQAAAGGESGRWYLRVQRDGRVGRPVRVYTDRFSTYFPSPTYQTRHITVNHKGVPFVMWARREAVAVRSLKGVIPTH